MIAKIILIIAQCSIAIPSENVRRFLGVKKWNIGINWVHSIKKNVLHRLESHDFLKILLRIAY